MADSTGALDSLYTKNFVVAILLSVFCGCIGLVCGLICYFTTQNPVAKKNAMICILIPVVIFVVVFILNVVLGVGGALLGGR